MARQIALERPDARVVFLSADAGWRYVDDIYNVEWLCKNDAYLDPTHLPTAPVVATHPAEAVAPWARFAWNRHSCRQAVKTSADLARIPVGGTVA